MGHDMHTEPPSDNGLYNIYIHAMCACLYACMLSLMPHGLTNSKSSVNCSISLSGGIGCQISESHSLHKIWLRTSCVVIFR